MTAAHRLPGSPLTDSQIDQLLALHRGGAVDRETAIGPHHKSFRRARCGCNPNVLGALREKGFSKSRVARPAGGSQQTLYWLTPAGVAKAQEITAETSA